VNPTGCQRHSQRGRPRQKEWKQKQDNHYFGPWSQQGRCTRFVFCARLTMMQCKSARRSRKWWPKLNDSARKTSVWLIASRLKTVRYLMAFVVCLTSSSLLLSSYMLYHVYFLRVLTVRINRRGAIHLQCPFRNERGKVQGQDQRERPQDAQ
jgi:hypothetical protein